MITIYEILTDGNLGRTKTIDPREGAPRGWTYDAPPVTDKPMKWQNNTWCECDHAPDISGSATNVFADLQHMHDVITQVTPLQFRRALRQMGWHAEWCQLITTKHEETQEWWDYSVQFESNDVMIHTLAAELNKTDSDVRSLFELAQQVT